MSWQIAKIQSKQFSAHPNKKKGWLQSKEAMVKIDQDIAKEKQALQKLAVI